MPEKSYPFFFKGMFTDIEPSKLGEGQFPIAVNMKVEQEGALSSRSGRKLLGTFSFSAWVNPVMIRKLRVIAGENPMTPGYNNVGAAIDNPRYILVADAGNSGNGSVIRTFNYTTFANVKQGLTSAAQLINKRMSVSCYSAGAVGNPWAFLAGDTRMEKDNGISPYTTLYAWGILPAYGVATAVATAVSGGGIASSSVDVGGGGYNVGDTFQVTGGGGNPSGTNYAQGTVLTVSGGAVLTYNISYVGLGYSSASGVATTATSGSGSGLTLTIVGGGGNLNGGASGSPSGSLPYSWIYCYVDGNTNNQGNPSQFMAASSQITNGQPLAVNNQAATVTVWGTDGTIYDVGDTNITNVAVYRAGGTFADGLYRFVGYTGTNPGMSGGVANSTTFVDNTSDAQLADSTTVFFDNDPPVVSSVPSPIVTKVASGPYSPGQNVIVTLSSAVGSQMTRGSTVFFGGANPEACIVQYINSSSSITVYLQFAHATGDSVEVDALTAQPCFLTCSAFDQVFVAGDPNNPHVLYQSKSGYPESFPIIDALGNAHSINVGTPSNGIQNIVEFRGQILCMNVSSLFEVAVIDGIMFTPAEVPGSRGLVSPWAWCMTDNEVWILCTDGVYSWDGNTFRKRSLAIDRIFNNRETGYVFPLDYGSNSSGYSNLQWTSMEFYDSKIMLHYADTDGRPWILICEPLMGDRWSQYDANLYNGGTVEGATTFQYREEDTGSLIVARTDAIGTNGAYFSIDDSIYVSGGYNYTADEYTPPLAYNTTSPDAGQLIPYNFLTPWFDLGTPFNHKLFTEILLDMDTGNFSGQTLASAIDVQIFYDYSNSYSDSYSITGLLAGRQPVSLLQNAATVSGQYTSYGRKARAMQLGFAGTAWPLQQIFYGLVFRYEDLQAITGGSATDWQDMGSRHDKKFHQMTITYDAPIGSYVIMVDTLSGPNAQVYTDAIQTFTLANAPTATPPNLGNTKMSKTFAIQNGSGGQIIAKMIRVRAVSAQAPEQYLPEANTFTVQKLDFEAEQFPPDVVAETPWDDGGYAYLKYANQIVLEVNTNNVAVTVNLQADGATVFTFTVTATETNRQRTIVTPTGLTGYRWRLYCNPTQTALNSSNNGMFQLFNHKLAFQQADRGEVGHTFDWDDLGHPYDKLLLTIVIEYDTTAGGPLTLQMDTISGVNGTTITTSAETFLLFSGRGKTEYAITANTIVKMVRIYPSSTPNISYKQWKYTFTKVDYPPDHVSVTEWRNASSPTDKDPSWLWIDMDTAGQTAIVNLHNENGAVLTVNHTGTSTNRMFGYAIAADTTAQMWQLQISETGGAKSQLFSWTFERWHVFEQTSPNDPPEVILACPWNDFGWPYPKLARNLILTINTGGEPCSVAIATSDGGIQQTFTVTTTYQNRRVVIAFNPNLSGLMWRPLFTPALNGIAQVWDWSMDVVKEPAAINQWTSYNQTFGYPGFKFIKQVFLEYTSPASEITITITSDTGSFSQTLPVHVTIGMERFYLPSVWGSGYNKSKCYSILITTVTSTDTFQLYGGSDIEWIAIGADQHAAYRHFKVGEFIDLPL